MKKYIFFCYSTRVGGGQRYVNYKVEYLIRKGWTPIVFTAYEQAIDTKEVVWNYIDQLEHHLNEQLTKSPTFWSKKKRNKTLDWLEGIVDKKDDDVVIIESHTAYFAEWGELLAERIHARNFCYILDEIYDNYGAGELLYFKYCRHELAVIRGEYINVLLRGFLHVDEPQKYKLVAAGGNHAVDISCNFSTNTNLYDINILYFGRYKQYCEEIKKGIKEFCKRHPELRIQLLIIGELRYLQRLEAIANLNVRELGFVSPVPRKVFSGIDVAISGAGSARIAAEEGVPTIVTNPVTFLASGILGYTVFDTLEDKCSYKYEDLLEEILFKDVIKGEPQNLGNNEDSEKEFDEHFAFLNQCEPELKYFAKKLSRNYSIKSKIGYYLRKHCRSLYVFLDRRRKKQRSFRGEEHDSTS